ncbi:anti-sigma factor family protein [Actinocorallia populi]|uniref:anti-sigma factor family protein n=1 Tax=Actinocorallia populi TaxID=2079200 RepID=UPI001300B588|nr:zf-HC2 domain-containing protein [Actinocorallia populi]
MSCLGDRLTALVDGELDHDGRDRALAHLAVCDGCRSEAESLRRLKRRLHSLKDHPVGNELLGRLYGLGDTPADPPKTDLLWPPQVKMDGPVPGDELMRRLYRLDEPGDGKTEASRYRRPRDGRPARDRRREAPRRRLPRARYLVAGAATLAALGAGTAPYVNTGNARVPKVSPSWSQVSVHNGGVSQVRLPRRQDEQKR